MASGSTGLQKGVMLAEFILSPIYLTTLVQGAEDDEDEEPEKREGNSWKKCLDIDDEGVISLKSWKEVTALKANKVNLAIALREIVRQAWGEYLFFTTIFPI